MFHHARDIDAISELKQTVTVFAKIHENSKNLIDKAKKILQTKPNRYLVQTESQDLNYYP